MSSTSSVFIDGEAGTTGLQIKERLMPRDDLRLIQLDEAVRKDETARREAMTAADVTILCLPDDAAREAALWAQETGTRLIDASSAHRVADGWTYGFPELSTDQRARIAAARLVTNPGCYALASVALLHPLTSAGVLPHDYLVSIFGISGYSGGGKGLINRFEDQTRDDAIADKVQAYGLGLGHKHLPEIQQYGGLARPPVFVPHRAAYYRGMLVEIGIDFAVLPGKSGAATFRDALATHYSGEQFVTVSNAEVPDALGPEDENGTNNLMLFVFGNAEGDKALLVAQLDNLGKGASGQAVQCLNLMLGLDEATGLV